MIFFELLVFTVLLVVRGQERTHAVVRSQHLARDRASLQYLDPMAREHFQEWQPIRIYVHIDQELPEERKRYLRDDLFPAVVRWLSQMLRVRRVQGRLRFKQHCQVLDPIHEENCIATAGDFQKCGEATIPLDHFEDGTLCHKGDKVRCETQRGGDGIPGADIALYVTALQTSACVGYLDAYASTCHQDQNDRPIAAALNLCTDNFFRSNEWDAHVAIALRETIVALGFDFHLFPFFRDDAGVPRTPRDENGMPPFDSNLKEWKASNDTIVSFPGSAVADDPTVKYYVALPRVISEARDHFDCSSIGFSPVGVALKRFENMPMRPSNWDERIMFTEIMTPLTDHAKFSRITMAFLEDTGWYKVDYDWAGPFKFGKGRGCDFIIKPCIENGATAFKDTFCTEVPENFCGGESATTIGCTHDFMGKAVCDACMHKEELPKRFQYFDQSNIGGSQESLDYCPVWAPYHTKDGKWSSNTCTDETTKPNDEHGENFGPESRCVMSSATGWAADTRKSPQGTCHQVSCDYDKRSLSILVDRHQVTCTSTEAGAQKKVNNKWSGFVVCPSFELVCNDPVYQGLASVSCRPPGVMRNRRCVCPAGYLDEDCSEVDTALERQQIPFGCGYFQKELVFKAGEPAAKSAMVQSWPLRPVVKSNLDLVKHFSIFPPLPEGLFLNDMDGTLDGTPQSGESRSAYLVRAATAGGRRACSTSIFITVNSDNVITPTLKTGQMNESLRDGPFASPSVRGVPLLCMTLGNVLFKEIQEDPGFEDFANQLLDALSEATACNNTVTGCKIMISRMLKLLSGGTRLEFFMLTLDDQLVSDSIFQTKLQQLLEEMHRKTSGYLANAQLYLISEEGEELLKLKTRERGEESDSKDSTEEDGSAMRTFLIIIVAVVVTLICCVCYKLHLLRKAQLNNKESDLDPQRPTGNLPANPTVVGTPQDPGIAGNPQAGPTVIGNPVSIPRDASNSRANPVAPIASSGPVSQ